MIATSRKPNTRSVPGARWPRADFRHHWVPAPRVVVDGRRLRTVLVGLGIAALTGLTAWVLASVSIWLVPAYLSLMVVTFGMPRAERTESPVTEPRADISGADADEPGQDSGAGCADGTGVPRPDAEPIPSIPAFEPVEAPTPPPDPAATTTTAKPRRSKSRSRKSAKLAVEPVPDASPVTWIRVGPGKFVRADAGVQPPSPVQAEETAPAANPVTDSPESAAAPSEIAADAHPETDGLESAVATDDHPATDGLAPTAPAPEAVATVADVPTDATGTPTEAPEVVADASPVTDAPEAVAPAPSPTVSFAIPSEPGPLDPTESTPDGEETVPSSAEEVSGSVAEEYGIAPSAFGPDTLDVPAVESLDPGPFEAFVPPRHDPVCIAEPDGLPTGVEARPVRLGSRRQRSWVRMALLPVGMASGPRGRGWDPESSRRRVQARPRPRAAVRCASPLGPRLRQAARRASGRSPHFHRAWRPRSPPGRSP